VSNIIIDDIGTYEGCLYFSVSINDSTVWAAVTPCGFIIGPSTLDELKDEIDACRKSGAPSMKYVPRCPPNLGGALVEIAKARNRDRQREALSELFVDTYEPEAMGDCTLVCIPLPNDEVLVLIYDSNGNCIGCAASPEEAAELAQQLGFRISRGHGPR